MSEDLKNRLKYIIATAEVFIDPTPKHPLGCAREAWIQQAKYWLTIDFEDRKHGKMFAIAFCSSYDSLLKRLNINVEHKGLQEDINNMSTGINWDVVTKAMKTLKEGFVKEKDDENWNIIMDIKNNKSR